MHVIERIMLRMFQKKVIIGVNQNHFQDDVVHFSFDQHYKLKQLKLKYEINPTEWLRNVLRVSLLKKLLIDKKKYRSFYKYEEYVWCNLKTIFYLDFLLWEGKHVINRAKIPNSEEGTAFLILILDQPLSRMNVL